MSIRLAASGLALAAVLMTATAARAQFFFQYYELSPRQIAGMLQDEGYDINGAMRRRGDVYVVDATSVSGRSVRLIVDAHRGRVIERYATSERRRWGDDGYDRRAARNEDSWSDEAKPTRRRNDLALGDPGSRGDDGLFGDRPTPPSSVPDAPKSKHKAVKKHKEPAIVTAPAAAPTPEPTAVAEPPKPAPSPSVAAVAPSAPVETPKPAVEETKRPVRVIKTTPEPEKPPVEAAKPTPEPSKAAEVRPAAEPTKAPETPKPEAPRKKINDLPVGTLD